MNKNQVKGRIRKAKGKATAFAGKVLHKPVLAAKGKLQQAAGTVEAAYGDLKSAAAKRTVTARTAAGKQGLVLEKKLEKNVKKQVRKTRKKAVRTRRVVKKKLAAARKRR